MKRALIVRHTPFEGAAGFRLPIEQAGYEFHRINVFDSGFQSLNWLDPDLILVMGGPMGVYESDAHPWIEGELAGLSARIAARRPTMGVCLGSQMIAAALGARVYPGPVREVGFAPVTVIEQNSPLRHVVDVPVLHWHGDTFDLPDGVERLAESTAYANQAFRRDEWLLALQFHPEMGEDPRIEQWLADADYISSAGTDAATVRAHHAEHGPGAVAAGRALLTEWLAGLRAGDA